MEEMIALVWSFRDKLQDIPYRITHRTNVKMHGAKITNMHCNCPAFTYQGKGKTCKHLTALKEAVADKSIENDDRFNLTPYGRALFDL
jgi:hypothetical protein